MKALIDYREGSFHWTGGTDLSHVAHYAGWWKLDGGWVTSDPFAALTAIEDPNARGRFDYTDKAKARLQPFVRQIKRSYAVECADADDAALAAEAFVAAQEGYTLYPYQKVGVAHILRTKKALIGDSMGLGKSAQALAAAAITQLPTVIVCPKAVATNWQREAAKWTGQDFTVLKGMKAKALAPNENYVIPYSVVGSWGKHIKAPLFLIVDEAHYCKSPGAQRTKAVAALAGRADHVVALTGTPQPNRSRELQAVLAKLLGCQWAEGAQFLEKFCGPSTIFNPRTRREMTIYNGSTKSRELSLRLRGSVMVRRTKDKVLPQLPQKRRSVVYLDPSKFKGSVDFDPELMEAFAEAIDKGFTIPKFDELSQIRANQAEAKIPLVLEYLKDTYCDDDGRITEPLVIFCHHKVVAEQLSAALGERCRCWHGGHSADQRDATLAAFQAEEIDCIVGTVGALGTGVDGLQHRCSTVLFAELDWVPGNLDQAEDRLCRIGQTASVLVQHLLVPGTLDSYILDTVMAKQEHITTVMRETREEKEK